MSLLDKNITLLPKTEREYNGHLVQRIMAVNSFDIKTDGCARRHVVAGDIGGWVDLNIRIQNSWVVNSSTVVGYNLLNSIIHHDSTLEYSGENPSPTIENSRISISNISGIVNMLDSEVTATDIKTSGAFDLRYSDIAMCKFDNSNCALENVQFSCMDISGCFECSYTGIGHPRFHLSGKKFNYNDGTVFKTHMIHELGSRDDNLFIFVIYDNLLPDSTSQTPTVYVSTGCFCDTLDVFEKAVKDKYGNGTHCNEKYYYDTYMMTVEYIRKWVNREGEWIKQRLANKMNRVLLDITPLTNNGKEVTIYEI